MLKKGKRLDVKVFVRKAGWQMNLHKYVVYSHMKSSNRDLDMKIWIDIAFLSESAVGDAGLDISGQMDELKTYWWSYQPTKARPARRRRMCQWKQHL